MALRDDNADDDTDRDEAREDEQRSNYLEERYAARVRECVLGQSPPA